MCPGMGSGTPAKPAQSWAPTTACKTTWAPLALLAPMASPRKCYHTWRAAPWCSRGSAWRPPACIRDRGHGLKEMVQGDPFWAGAPAESAERREEEGEERDYHAQTMWFLEWSDLWNPASFSLCFLYSTSAPGTWLSQEGGRWKKCLVLQDLPYTHSQPHFPLQATTLYYVCVQNTPRLLATPHYLPISLPLSFILALCLFLSKSRQCRLKTKGCTLLSLSTIETVTKPSCPIPW